MRSTLPAWQAKLIEWILFPLGFDLKEAGEPIVSGLFTLRDEK